jgi:hypothetical protein
MIDIGWKIHGSVIYNDDDEVYVQAMTREVVDDRSLIIWALMHGWEVKYHEAETEWHWTAACALWRVEGYEVEGPKLNVELRRALTDELIFGKRDDLDDSGDDLLHAEHYMCKRCKGPLCMEVGPKPGGSWKAMIMCSKLKKGGCVQPAWGSGESERSAEHECLEMLIEQDLIRAKP